MSTVHGVAPGIARSSMDEALHFRDKRSARQTPPQRIASNRAGIGTRTKRVLFISYAFPPVGGAGVQRTTKFVKYLSRYGWDSSVLTVANPSVPALDNSLASDVPPATIVRRARTWEPAYGVKSAVGSGTKHRGIRSLIGRAGRMILQPDPQVLWLPNALREGKRLLNELAHDVIVVSGPPFSSFLVAAVLSRWTGLPLVLDYRDEWSLCGSYSENKRTGHLSRFFQSQMEDYAARSARLMIATTRSSKEALEAVRRRAGSRARLHWIYNGFDPDDFPASPVERRADRDTFRLAYVGTLWELTSVAPLVKAVQLLSHLEPSLAARLELVFAGRRVAAQQRELEKLKGLPCRITQHPYVDHDRAAEIVRSSDATCALLSDLPGAGRVVPAKIFECMAARRRILAIAPDGELRELLGNHPAAECCAPSDINGITSWLATQLTQLQARNSIDADHFSDWDHLRYSRDRQTAELAKLLDSIC